MGGEGGDWSGSDMSLGHDFYQLISRRPLVAFKILTLAKIIELGGSPQVKITLINEVVIEGCFFGFVFERGSFKLNIDVPNNEDIKLEALLVKEIFVNDQDSEHITEQSILNALKFDLEIEKYFKGNKVGTGCVS